MSRSLIVLPDDSAKPILDAIDAAGKSLRIKMFALSDPRILEALIRAHKRAVKIRVMLNPARRSAAGSRPAKASNVLPSSALRRSSICARPVTARRRKSTWLMALA